MSDDVERRHFPYIWPTWVTGLISGDKQCWWAAWFKAHHAEYPKIEDRNEDRLKLWKADHAQFVRETAAALAADGWLVTVENQNKLNVKGDTANVGACPDIVAERPDTADARIVDCKTGRERDSDFWQVVTYIALSTLKGSRLHGKAVTGAVQYRGRVLEIGPREATDGAPKVFQAIRTVAMDMQPPQVPSERECEECNIAVCQARISQPQTIVETTEF